MVLGDATLYKMVDYSRSSYQCIGTMPDRNAFPALLQFPGCVFEVAVLATSNNIPLLRTPLPRPRFPRLLPDPLLTTPRRIVRPLPSLLFLATPLFHDLLDLPLTTRLHAIPGAPSLLHTRLHLVAQKPGHSTEFPGPAGVHGSVPAVGVDAV